MVSLPSTTKKHLKNVGVLSVIDHLFGGRFSFLTRYSYLYIRALFVLDHLFGGRFQLVSRYWTHFTPSENKANSERFVRLFVNECGVRPDARVLDVGCGDGRIAVALTRYMNEAGSYEGWDIIPEAITSCRRTITSKYPNFHFQLADVANKAYNPNGAVRASEYTFPYNDASFDFVFLNSIFTHLLPQDLERYLSEATRVLKTGGKSFITYFLLTPEILDRIDRGETRESFIYDGDRFKTVSEALPESAVAYQETYIKKLYKQNGLTMTKIIYGNWSSKEPPQKPGYQDFVCAEKAAL